MKLNQEQEINEESMETFPTWNEESANSAVEISQQIEAQLKAEELESKLLKEANQESGIPKNLYEIEKIINVNDTIEKKENLKIDIQQTGAETPKSV